MNSSRPQIRTETPNISGIHHRVGNLCSQLGWTNFSPPQVNTFYDVRDHNRPLCVYTNAHLRTPTHTPNSRIRPPKKGLRLIYKHLNIHTIHTYMRMCKYTCIQSARRIEIFPRKRINRRWNRRNIYPQPSPPPPPSSPPLSAAIRPYSEWDPIQSRVEFELRAIWNAIERRKLNIFCHPTSCLRPSTVLRVWISPKNG